MPQPGGGPLSDAFLATADAVARERPGVDPELAREAFREAATLLHDGLALDGLDAHDTRAVVAALRADLVTADPGAAIRARSRATAGDPGDLHDPEAVSAAYLLAAQVLQI